MIGATLTTTIFVYGLATTPDGEHYEDYRKGLGRAILLGLELLVAGGIVRTVAVEPSFGSVGVLAIIVIIRTFLSMSLQLEIEGNLRWDAKKPRLEAGSSGHSRAARARIRKGREREGRDDGYWCSILRVPRSDRVGVGLASGVKCRNGTLNL